ncbi:MAG: 50S ribosomal protein L31e [Thermoplasmata archaeon]|nr:50S ribosomal protein L31e [Thermoplasmata archaeon]
MAEEEYIYTISMAKAKTIPSSKRTKWATHHIRSFIRRHIPESDRIWIDPKLNHLIFSKGRTHIPSKIRVRVIHFEDDLVEVSLPEET